LEASRVLGVEEKDVIFLEVRNGTLAENCESTISKVVNILEDKKPEEIFVPYYREPSANATGDHLAMNRIVVSALRILRRKIVVNSTVKF
jgi:LmbE family N-acetylglucosaminyl deacetylase